jgi:hydroxyacylglutathione hydrolase
MLMFNLSFNEIQLQQFINPIFNSNTFTINKENQELIVVIDPGDPKLVQLKIWLEKKNKSRYIDVILSHEHYDHIAGLNLLCKLFDVRLFLSDSCFNNLNNSVKNLSKYLNSDEKNEIKPNQIILVKDNDTLNISGLDFIFYHTPGHSEGSICFGINNLIFTGDSFLDSIKTTTNLPGGSKSQFKLTSDKLRGILNNYQYIIPGHGEIFKNNNFNEFKS